MADPNQTTGSASARESKRGISGTSKGSSNVSKPETADNYPCVYCGIPHVGECPVPPANPTREQHLEIALQEIADPVGHIQREAEAKGHSVNAAAIPHVVTVHYLSQIARRALEDITQAEPPTEFTLRARLRSDGSVMLTAAAFPMFNIVGSDLSDALRIAAIIAPDCLLFENLS